MTPQSCVYVGDVVHKRLRPRKHGLSYRVFAMLLDVDTIDAAAGALWLFSRNRFNLVSFHDRDHGRGDGTSVASHVRATLTDAGLGHACARVYLLCYPRVLGYGFNPISVYYGYDEWARLAAVIYEVNNTFGERRSYVVEIGREARGGEGLIHAHGCDKQLYVSPFTEMEGRYGFRLGEPGSDAVLGVSLRDARGPVLKTHFRGTRRPLCDATLARLSILLPLQSFKVIAAIHFEALRLWMKGVPPTARPPAPRYGVTHIGPAVPVPVAQPIRSQGLS